MMMITVKHLMLVTIHHDGSIYYIILAPLILALLLAGLSNTLK